MNKNLKKVISTVAALAISASAVSAFAVNFPDVPEDASYAQAVQELSALGVVSGFEDGTFRPDELVTRAQMAKFIVDALAETEQAEASKATTQFNDVSADHWAKGYINQGVADGFISGYSATEFGPDDNVTYVQAQSMLVRAIGYETYAQGSGGWPNGYKTWAATSGITDGISGISDDTQLTRAQVAQLVDNAMGSPIVVISGYDTAAWDGTRVPKLKVKDGKGEDYQTLFTKRHDAYKVYGRVIDTPAGNMEKGKVAFRVEKADNFDDEYIKVTDAADATKIDAYIGDSKADNYLTVYSQALIQKDDNDEWTILSIAPAAVNKSVTVLAEDVDESKTDLDNNVIYFYPAGTTRNATKYKLAATVDLYVNGVESGTFDAQAFADYIGKEVNGKFQTTNNMVTLQKTTSVGSTSTEAEYDTIFIDAYKTAVVDQVIDRTSTTQINLKAYSEGMKTSLKIDKDDDDKTYTFTTMDGEEVDPATLEQNTVLTISYDMTAADWNASSFVHVLVSTDVVESGKCTSELNNNNEIVVGGEKYEVVTDMSPEVKPESSLNYTLYLDVFGKVAFVDEDSSTKKLAILKNVYDKANGDTVADIITKDGQEINEVKVDDDNAVAYKALIKDGTKLETYPQQVIDYKLSSTNKLTINDNAVLPFTKAENGEYKENSKKIGNIRLNDSTVILDIEDVNTKDTYTTLSLSDLKDGNEYTAYGYDKNNDGECRFVIITDGKSGYDSTTQLSIFLEKGTDVDEEGDEVDTMTVINDGEQKTVVIDEDVEYTGINDLDGLGEGDAILYVVEADKATKVAKVFATKALLDGTTYEDLKDDMFALNDTNAVLVDAATFNFNDKLSDGDEDEVNVQFGMLVKNGNSTTLVTTSNNGVVEPGAGIDLVTSNAKVYTYNFDNSKKNFGRFVLDDGVTATPDVKAAWDEDKTTYDLTNEGVGNDVVFALVRTFDTDEAQEIYQIVAE